MTRSTVRPSGSRTSTMWGPGASSSPFAVPDPTGCPLTRIEAPGSASMLTSTLRGGGGGRRTRAGAGGGAAETAGGATAGSVTAAPFATGSVAAASGADGAAASALSAAGAAIAGAVGTATGGSSAVDASGVWISATGGCAAALSAWWGGGADTDGGATSGAPTATPAGATLGRSVSSICEVRNPTTYAAASAAGTTSQRSSESRRRASRGRVFEATPIRVGATVAGAASRRAALAARGAEGSRAGAAAAARADIGGRGVTGVSRAAGSRFGPGGRGGAAVATARAPSGSDGGRSAMVAGASRRGGDSTGARCSRAVLAAGSRLSAANSARIAAASWRRRPGTPPERSWSRVTVGASKRARSAALAPLRASSVRTQASASSPLIGASSASTVVPDWNAFASSAASRSSRTASSACTEPALRRTKSKSHISVRGANASASSRSSSTRRVPGCSTARTSATRGVPSHGAPSASRTVRASVSGSRPLAERRTGTACRPTRAASTASSIDLPESCGPRSTRIGRSTSHAHSSSEASTRSASAYGTYVAASVVAAKAVASPLKRIPLLRRGTRGRPHSSAHRSRSLAGGLASRPPTMGHTRVDCEVRPRSGRCVYWITIYTNGCEIELGIRRSSSSASCHWNRPWWAGSTSRSLARPRGPR